MLRQLAHRVFPGPIGELLRRRVGRRREQTPMAELGEQHIARLHVVLDRRALLRMLPQHAIVAELGVDQGAFSRDILEYAQPQTLYLIDSWNGNGYDEGLMNSVRNRFNSEIAAGRVVIERGRSVDVLERFADGSFDWVYIDTDHSYATTRRELELCRAKVKPGGIIAGHDYARGSLRNRYRYGVIEAVNEFCTTYGWEMIFLTHEPSRFISYALREIKNDEP